MSSDHSEEVLVVSLQRMSCHIFPRFDVSTGTVHRTFSALSLVTYGPKVWAYGNSKISNQFVWVSNFWTHVIPIPDTINSMHFPPKESRARHEYAIFVSCSLFHPTEPRTRRIWYLSLLESAACITTKIVDKRTHLSRINILIAHV